MSFLTSQLFETVDFPKRVSSRACLGESSYHDFLPCQLGSTPFGLMHAAAPARLCSQFPSACPTMPSDAAPSPAPSCALSCTIPASTRLRAPLASLVVLRPHRQQVPRIAKAQPLSSVGYERRFLADDGSVDVYAVTWGTPARVGSQHTTHAPMVSCR